MIGMNFSKAFGCGKITPSLEDGTAEETFMKGLEAVQKDGDDVDWKEVAKYYLRAASEGLPEACCNLGVCYATGRGVPQSADQAVHWYHVAADKGLPRAQSNLAGCYASGRGVVQDWTLAATWFRKAAEAGDGAAACSLGAMHAEGKGVSHDGFAAAYWFHRAAKTGLHSAMFNLALCYEQGTGCGLDHAKAVYWYLRAARGSSALAEMSSERVAQLRQESGVDVDMEMADQEDDFALSSPPLLPADVRRTGTNESRCGPCCFLRGEQAEDLVDLVEHSPQDRAISMDGDHVCIDKKSGRLQTKMSGAGVTLGGMRMGAIDEEEEEEGKMRRVGGGWEVFGAMLGFRKDLRKQRRRDEER